METPVKDWIHFLHRERFGYVVGEMPRLTGSKPEEVVGGEELARLYCDRNETRPVAIADDDVPSRGRRF